MNSKLQKFKFSNKLLSSVKILYPNTLLKKLKLGDFLEEIMSFTFGSNMI